MEPVPAEDSDWRECTYVSPDTDVLTGFKEGATENALNIRLGDL